MVGIGTVVLVALALLAGVPWAVRQRHARRLCRQQESPRVDRSFEGLPGLTGAGLVVLARPRPWTRRWWGVVVPASETWHCLLPGRGAVAVTARYRRTGWGWQVRWDVRLGQEADSAQALPHHAATGPAAPLPPGGQYA